MMRLPYRPLSLALLLLTAAGCHKVFGDFEVDDAAFDTGGKDGKGGKGGTSPVCDDGAFRCQGAKLEQCDDGRGWKLLDTCTTPALCNAKEGACKPAFCQPDTFSCSGSELRVCNREQTAWAFASACASEALCDAAAGKCRPAVCQPGEDFQCAANGDLNECKPDRTGYRKRTSCATQAHCNAAEGVCNPAPCDEGDHQCSGAALQRCKADRSGWEPVKTCATPALCNAQRMDCDAPACAVGAHDCAADDLLVCNEGRTGFVKQASCSPGLCDEIGGQCDLCPPNSYSCDGAVLHQCSATGQINIIVQDCLDPELCDADSGTCLPPMGVGGAPG